MKTTTKRMIKNGKPLATPKALENFGGEAKMRKIIAWALIEARREGKRDVARRALIRGWSYGTSGE